MDHFGAKSLNSREFDLTTKHSSTKFTKDLDMVISYLRALRDLRGEISATPSVAALLRHAVRSSVSLSLLPRSGFRG
jgi:hypothetical protein